MSKQNNVNPDHYKVAGSDHQGEGILHTQNKHELKRARKQVLPGWKSRATHEKAEDSAE